MGRYLGRTLTADGFAHEIRLGPEVVTLTESEARCWTTTAHDVDLVDRSKLVHRRLLTPMAERTDLSRFARRHRMLPLLLGLGPSADTPDRYGLGLPGAELLTVAGPLYQLWASAAVHPTLWHTCTSFADSQRNCGNHDLWLTDPTEVLTGLLTNLPILIDIGAAYLDIVPGAG